MKVHGNAWRGDFVSNTFVFMGCIEWELCILGFLRWMGPSGPRVLRFDGPLARGLWYRRFAAMKFYSQRYGNGFCVYSAARRRAKASFLWKEPALRDSLPASHCHSERSEESRYKSRMRQLLLNTGRQEVFSILNIYLIRCEQHFGDQPPPAALPPLVPTAPPFPRCAGAQ